MILHIQPITYVLPLSIYRKRATLTDVVDEQWNQFFRKLIRPVVVRAVSHYGRHPVGVMIGPYKMITRGFGSRIRAMRLILALLSEERIPERASSTLIAGQITIRPCKFESPIDLIR